MSPEYVLEEFRQFLLSFCHLDDGHWTDDYLNLFPFRKLPPQYHPLSEVLVVFETPVDIEIHLRKHSANHVIKINLRHKVVGAANS